MRDFSFYPFYEKDGILHPLLFDEDKNPKEILYKTSGFVESEYFYTDRPSIELSRFEPEIKDFFDTDSELKNGDPEKTFCYAFYLDEIEKIAESRGLKEGYTSASTLSTYHKIKDSYDKEEYAHWNMELEPANAVAEWSMEKRNEVGHIAFVDTYSKEYIMNLLYEVLNSLNKFEPDVKYLVIVRYSF